MKYLRMTLAVTAALSLPAVLPAFAATGMAWDSVTKMSTGDVAPQPGNFAGDFAAASQPAASPQQRGGLFGGIAAGALAGAGGMIAAMQNGTAAHNYVAGSFRRTDDLGTQTATILDCSARTLTSLDLAKKTYRVTSLDAPRPAAGGGGSAPGRSGGTSFQDDGSKIAIQFVTTPLGPKTIDTLPTDGYQFAMTTTITKPSGESQSAQMQMTSYFSGFATPNLACSAAGAGAAVPGLPAMAMYRQIMDAMQTSSGDPRITVTSSGPAAPAGKLPLFMAITPKAQNGRGGFAMTIENGNVHQISDGDKSIFAVPPDFTKLP